MRTVNSYLIFCLAGFLTGCSNALYFYETEKISLTLEARPDNTQPVQGSLGIKQRLVLITPGTQRQNQTQPLQNTKPGKSSVDNGDALSAITSFNFKITHADFPAFNPVLIQTAFITGDAASGLQPEQALDAAKAIQLNGVDIATSDALAQRILKGVDPSNYDKLNTITKIPCDKLTEQNSSDLKLITRGVLDKDICTPGLFEALQKLLNP